MILSSELQVEALRAIRARLHNQGPDTLQAEVTDHLERIWADHVDRWLPQYRRGGEILDHGLDQALFEVTSLGTWLAVAAEAGVASVPALFVGSFDVAAAIGGGRIPGRPETADAVASGLFLRPDVGCAAPAKVARGAGYSLPSNGGADGDGSIAVDERLSHLLLQYLTVDGSMPVWARPVVPDTSLRTVSGGAPWGRRTWPVEYRVFVEASKVVGVSTYYLQAPARERSLVEEEAGACRDLTVRMMETLARVRAKPWHPRYSEHPSVGPDSGLWFSCDFMILADGSPIFLEGGPAHLHSPNWGAHPCCFEPTKIRGLACARGDIDPDWA